MNQSKKRYNFKTSEKSKKEESKNKKRTSELSRTQKLKKAKTESNYNLSGDKENGDFQSNLFTSFENLIKNDIPKPQVKSERLLSPKEKSIKNIYDQQLQDLKTLFEKEINGLFTTHTTDRTSIEKQWQGKNKKCFDDLMNKFKNIKEQRQIFVQNYSKKFLEITNFYEEMENNLEKFQNEQLTTVKELEKFELEHNISWKNIFNIVEDKSNNLTEDIYVIENKNYVSGSHFESLAEEFINILD